ncbi:MAG: hypothetical protein V2A73_13810, partial [Pseudomonadota bacterium]
MPEALLLALAILCVVAPHAHCGGVQLTVPPSDYAIVRETPVGSQRMVYVDITNPGAAVLESVELVC